jgi:hypothetical protein
MSELRLSKSDQMDFWMLLGTYHRQNPSQRDGQAMWNTLRLYWPKLAEELHGTEFDPFYDDSKIGAFLERIMPS